MAGIFLSTLGQASSCHISSLTWWNDCFWENGQLI